MMDPNSETFTRLFKDKKRIRYVLYAELIYALLLLTTVVFAIQIFWRLMIIQFVLILAFFVISWAYNWHDKKTGKVVAVKKDRSFFLKTFMEESPVQKQKSIFRTISLITVILSFAIAAFSCYEIFVDIAGKTQAGQLAIIENILMSADTFYVFTTAGIMFGLLFGKKRLTRNSSVATMFVSLILLAFHPVLWWMYIIGLVIGVVGYTLYHLNQL